MNRNKIFAAGMIITMLFATACNPKKDNGKKKFVKKWKITAMTALMPDSMINEYVSKSVLEFKDDGSYSISGAENMTQNGKFSVLDEGKKLVFTFANRSDTTDVTTLTDDELVISSKLDQYTMKASAIK